MGNKHGKPLTAQTLSELRNEVDFSRDEIQNWYKEYNQSLQKGKTELTRQEFKVVYNSLFAGDASDFADQVFRTFDKDGSGSVDFHEFLIGLCVSGSSEFDTKLKWAFNMYDVNGDGYISKDEMKMIIRAIFKMTNAAGKESPERMAKELFRQCDFDHDGRISWDEFRKGARDNHVIVDLLQCDPG